MIGSDNFHAVEVGGKIHVYPPRQEYYHYMEISAAETFRDQLTAAIEEAKRQSYDERFHQWFLKLPLMAAHASYAMEEYRFLEGAWFSKSQLRAIWDAATKAAGEGK